ncbi:MAG: membrane dipeptidase [Bryobacteraceae bacterium]|nr:membrane dipeptidase [Bryobacteraceae bacterium]
MKFQSILAAALLAAPLFAQAPGRQKRTVTEAEVAKVHKSAILIDTHNDITGSTVDGLDIGLPNTDHHTDLARMKQGGMGAQFFAVFVASTYVEGNRSAHRTLDMIDTVKHDIAGRYPKDFLYSTTSDDIRRAHKEGKIAALMGIEGGHAIEDDLRLLRRFYDLGIRYMTLTHTNDNNWAGSSGSKENKGLTPFGKDVVREMNRLGMMVDISHVSDKTFYDALETSQAPVFASHSSCRAISPVPRNMTDEMISAMAKRGGVIQINFDCGYLNPEIAKVSAERMKEFLPKMMELRKQYPNDPKGMRAAMRELRSKMPAGPRATLPDVIKHINHVVKVAGVDAVGLGSDFDGVMCVPENLDSVNKWPNLTRALLEEGYTAAEVRKIYGENLLRYMAAVEKTSKEIRTEAAKPAPMQSGAQ